jgi:hypothetical protein
MSGEAGTQRWYDADNRLHRDGDLPVLVLPDGEKQWFHHGKLHRDDLPAVVSKDGLQEWYRHGRLHRRHDLPAVVFADGTQWWYRRGKRHRDNDLPALVYADSTQEWSHWWVDGKPQTPEDRAQTRRWSALRAAFVGAAVGRARD